MKATITDVPQPKPPRVVMLEMTEDEAKRLATICGYDETVPEALGECGFNVLRVARFLDSVSNALRDAGVAGLSF